MAETVLYLTVEKNDPYDYIVFVNAPVEGDTTSLGATSVRDALQRAADWYGTDD